MLRGNEQPPELLAAIAQHVLGHRITRIEFTRELDEKASHDIGYPVDNIDVMICLDNNVGYVCRLVVNSLAVVSRAEALVHISPDDVAYEGVHGPATLD